MEKYDYRESVTADIMEYLAAHYDCRINEDEADRIYDRLWVCDSVTGNASGSYTMSTWKAEENICHNLDLLGDALFEFGEVNALEKGPEWCDMTIRCYLIGALLHECVDKWNEAYPEEEDGEE